MLSSKKIIYIYLYFVDKRIKELDILRILAMLFVITFHFGYQYITAGLPCFNFFYTTVNYDFGNIAVTIFIAISGGILYKKYGTVNSFDKNSLKKFYLKRAKAIYPPFWILSLYIPLTMLRHFITEGNAFFMGHPLTLLFTVVGFDGYVKAYGINTYAFCGDWFVGAILLLYILFPMLAKCYRKFPAITLGALAVLYALQYSIPAKYDDLFSSLPVTIVFKFCLGFFLVENLEKLRKFRVALISFITFTFISFVDIPGRINTDCLGFIAAIALFVVVFNLAPYLLRLKAVNVPLEKLVTLSYCVFLVQHVGIVWAKFAFVKIFAMQHWNFTAWNVSVLLVLTFAAIIAATWILKRISDWTSKQVSKFLS